MKNKLKKNSRKNMMLILSTTAFAAADGGSFEGTANNFLNFLFTAARFGAVIAIGYGVVQLFMSMTSHDASQRLQGILFFIGGLIFFFIKNILEVIGVKI